MDISNILTDTINSFSRSSVSVSENRTELHVNEKELSRDTRSVPREDIDRIISTLNHTAAKVDERVAFSYNEDAHRVVMRIVDDRTNEVLRQIPSKEILSILEHMNELIGTFVDESR